MKRRKVAELPETKTDYYVNYSSEYDIVIRVGNMYLASGLIAIRYETFQHTPSILVNHIFVRDISKS